MIVALVPRVGGTSSLVVGLHRHDKRALQDNFVLRQELADRMADPAASGPIDELVVLYRETPEELGAAFKELIGPITEIGDPT